MHKLQITYEQLLETIQEGIWVYDADSNTTFVNPKMAEFLGYKAEEMTGKPIYDFFNQEVIKNIEKRVERRKSGISETYEEKLKH
jgi:PAS domain S-box-containing protein